MTKRVDATAEPASRTAGRRQEWPTLWHRDQIPFPWGAPKRLSKAKARALEREAAAKAKDGAQ
jgi:hypothetical protein